MNLSAGICLSRVVIQGRALTSTCTCEAPGWLDGSWMMQNNRREITTRTTVRYDRTANILVSPDKQIKDSKRVHETEGPPVHRRTYSTVLVPVFVHNRAVVGSHERSGGSHCCTCLSTRSALRDRIMCRYGWIISNHSKLKLIPCFVSRRTGTTPTPPH